MAFFGGFAPTMLVAKNLVATNVEVAKKKASNDDDDDPLRSSTSAKNSSTTNSNNSPPTSAAPSSSSLMPPQHHQQQQHHQHHMGAPSPVGRRPGASPIPPPVYHQSGSQQGYTSAPQTSAVISSSATAAMDSMSGNGAYRSMHLQHIPPPQQQHIQHHQYHPMQQQQQQQPHIRHGPPPSPLPPQHFQQQHQQQIGMPPVNGQSAGGDDIRLLLERQNQLVEMQRLQLEHQNRIIAEQQRMMDMERQQILIQQQQQQQQQQSLPMSRTGSAYSRRASNYNSVDSGLGPELVHQGNPVEADQVYRSEILGKQHAGISNSTGRASSHYSVDTLTSPVSSTANAENNPLSTSAVSTSTNATAVATANGKKPSGLAVTLDDLLLALGDTINELQDVKTPTSPGGSVMKTPASPTGANVSKGLEMARSPSFGGGLGAEIEGGLGEEMVQFTVGSLLQTSALFSGYLSKLSISRQTGSRIWKRRFFILDDGAKLFLYRSHDPSELPLTFLPLTSASGSLTPVNADGGSAWIIDLHGEGAATDGSVVERAWSLQCPNEESMVTWLDHIVPAVHQSRHFNKRPSVASVGSAGNGGISMGGSANIISGPASGAGGIVRVTMPIPVPVPSVSSSVSASAINHSSYPAPLTPASPPTPNYPNTSSPISPSPSAGFHPLLSRRPSTSASVSSSYLSTRRPSSAGHNLEHFPSSNSPTPNTGTAERQMERERQQRMQYEQYMMQQRLQQEAQASVERQMAARGASVSPMPAGEQPGVAMGREPSLGVIATPPASPNKVGKEREGRSATTSTSSSERSGRSKSVKRLPQVDVRLFT